MFIFANSVKNNVHYEFVKQQFAFDDLELTIKFNLNIEKIN